jgi:hypothetical protein
MKPILPTLSAILTLAFTAAPAVQAGGCLDLGMDRGYVYVTSTCQKFSYRKRSSPCYGEQSGLVAFVSGVVASGRNDDPSPREQFNDAYEEKYGERVSGDESHCYESRSEALSARSKKIGEYKRGGWEVETVHLRDAHY